MALEDIAYKGMELYLDTVGYASGFYLLCATLLKAESHLDGDPISYREAITETREYFAHDSVKEFKRQMDLTR